jgi:hypothetical protein
MTHEQQLPFAESMKGSFMLKHSVTSDVMQMVIIVWVEWYLCVFALGK